MRLLAVDGNSIVNRAFYGIRPLTTKDGQFTNAIYGFLTMLYKIKNEENPDAVAIAFDLKTPTVRHKAYAGYKATRKGMPEELASQMEPLKKLLINHDRTRMMIFRRKELKRLLVVLSNRKKRMVFRRLQTYLFRKM